MVALMSEGESEQLDLPAYLRRIEYAGERDASRAVLEALHQAHVTHIPFENLDILLGRAIALDLDSLQAKLVAGRRGGYCFEQNLLFAAVLRAFGFTVTQLAARVRLGSDALRPRTHMTLQVEVDGGRWLADVGFGAAGPLLPVPLGGGEASRQNAWSFRIVDEAGQSLLQSSRGASWEDLYVFSHEPQHRVDYELASHYTSTHPSSKFTQVATAQRIAPDMRFTLRDRDYSEERGAEMMRRTLADDDEVLDVLAETFGLKFPPGTRFQRNLRR
jgi:N-hydroxyarylamine O-acetyltransferase